MGPETRGLGPSWQEYIDHLWSLHTNRSFGASPGEDPASVPALLNRLGRSSPPTSQLPAAPHWGTDSAESPRELPATPEAPKDGLPASPLSPAALSAQRPQKAPGCPAHAPHDSARHTPCCPNGLADTAISKTQLQRQLHREAPLGPKTLLPNSIGPPCAR